MSGNRWSDEALISTSATRIDGILARAGHRPIKPALPGLPPPVHPYSPAAHIPRSAMGRVVRAPYKHAQNTGGIVAGVRRVATQGVPREDPEIEKEPEENAVIEPAPLRVVQMTPPIEATLRILLNSVPYLIGAAVVRQPAVGDAVAAQVGRMPWLHDRRLLSLQLPDETLPANRAVVLDWPVPYQAEWVGVPPRLLISRLVAAA